MLKKRLKHAIRPIYRSAKRRAADTLYKYGKNELATKLEDFGVRSGDALMVHSGFDQFNGFDGSPDDVIGVFREVIGEQGNLLMMSMPYGGSSQRYADRQATFDVRKTPSALGLISETFRRRDDVVRSANALHPVLASGPLAKWLTIDHELLHYSCDRRSPFGRFAKIGGKFLFFDAVFRALTFVHYVEHKHRSELPVPLYEPTPVTMITRLKNGKSIESKQYLFGALARERRDFGAIENTMRSKGRLKQERIGNTDLLFCTASDVVSTADELVMNGTGFYR
ncbi:MAG: AAC(3) family N-acetyltransferase [Gammaproteobacteria bacterium]